MWAFLFLVIGFGLAGLVSEWSLKELTAEEQGRLMKETAIYRKLHAISLFVCLGLSFFVDGYIGLVVFLLCCLVSQGFAIRKTIRLNFSRKCQNGQIAAVVIADLGILLTLCAGWLGLDK
ncbi:hypothetical protein [Chitinibacter sp. S2-10]|uniref:hypothetical protein n=1 Tax=Chitinibacter sp. S2-10 TaxID=3373597 RepID=UPI00397725DB